MDSGNKEDPEETTTERLKELVGWSHPFLGRNEIYGILIPTETEVKPGTGLNQKAWKTEQVARPSIEIDCLEKRQPRLLRHLRAQDGSLQGTTPTASK